MNKEQKKRLKKYKKNLYVKFNHKYIIIPDVFILLNIFIFHQINEYIGLIFLLILCVITATIYMTIRKLHLKDKIETFKMKNFPPIS